MGADGQQGRPAEVGADARLAATRAADAMSPEEYTERMRAMGVDRGSLAKRFEDSNPAICHDKRQAQPGVSRRMTSAVLGTTEDLSALNPGRHDAGKRSGAIGGRNTQAQAQARTNR
jgi:hypothetical protein